MSVQIQNLRIALGQFRLGPLDLDLPDQGVVLVRGANGSGKTSLLKTLMGRLRLQEGVITGVNFPAATVGIESLLMGSWTVKQNIHWFSQLLKMRPNQDQLKHISPLLHQQVFHLSTGMKRQVELSFALSMEFPTLFLDEPLNPLDRKQRDYYIPEIFKKAEGSLIFMTSHYEAELKDYPTRVVTL
jgi:ABC-type multidrug transport system ATPase subunit